jgi:ribonuclease HI
LRNDWRTSSGQRVKNKDLWEALLGEVERWAEVGLKITFWRIPRDLNTVADGCAKDAAKEDSCPEQFSLVQGVLV